MTGRFLPSAVLGAVALALALTGCQRDSQGGADSAAAPSVSAAPGDTAPAGGSSAAGAQGAMLDPNTATREQLVAIPAMNAAGADALVAGRPYQDMRGVDRVLANHLGEQARDSVYARLWKPLDLNSASGDEILLIPGVGPRMRHEFEEYRPYRSMAQFRREIGKYVDEAEVARLERYVMIR